MEKEKEKKRKRESRGQAKIKSAEAYLLYSNYMPYALTRHLISISEQNKNIFLYGVYILVEEDK